MLITKRQRETLRSNSFVAGFILLGAGVHAFFGWVAVATCIGGAILVTIYQYEAGSHPDPEG